MNSLKLSLCAVAMTAFSQAQAQQGPDLSQVEEHATDLGHGLYALIPAAGNVTMGVGSNVTVAVGSDGIIVVDTQFAPLYGKLKAKIASLSGKPVKYVIDTHYHNDHTGGNAAFAKDGAVLFAQENVVKRLATPPLNFSGQPGTPAPVEALPAQTYSAASQLHVGGLTAEIMHPANPAHTDTDSIIYFPDANVLSSGDCFTTNNYPTLDIATGSTIDGYIAAVDMMLRLVNDQTRIVPGHGPLSNKAGLTEYRAMLVTARDRIAKAKREGKNEEQVVAENPLADLDARWKSTNTAIATRFMTNIYRTVK